MSSELRPAWVEIDLGALAHNIALLSDIVAPVALCAVVKANAYGHGASAVAATAVEAGAVMLAVSTVEEGLELREARVGAPILLLSEPAPQAIEPAVAAGLTFSVYHPETLDELARIARQRSVRVAVHLKVDTGMHRVGASPEQLRELAARASSLSEVIVEGLWTHLASADDAEDPLTEQQLDRLDEARAQLVEAGVNPVIVHAANSAGALFHPRARGDLVRIGIAMYGYLPARDLVLEQAGGRSLSPVLSLKAEVQHVQRLPAGEALSYGQRYRLERDSFVATVPLGYHDGVARSYGLRGGQVLLGGARRPIAGAVTMDQLLVDCGEYPVCVGEEVVLLGRQGSEQIDAWEWGNRLDLLAYEVLCGIGDRVPRRVLDTGQSSTPISGR